MTPLSQASTAPTGGARWRTWWLRRLERQDDWLLTHRNLYILPTRAGLMLGLTLLLLLLGSINYQLSLGYLLTFLLAGSTVSAMHLTHRNLRGLRLRLHAPAPVFAGMAATVDVVLHNPSRHPRHAVSLQWLDRHPITPLAAVTDASAQEDTLLALSCSAPHRGKHPLPALRVASRFPIGAFETWSWWRPAAQLLVYPAPETPAPPMPWNGATERPPKGTHSRNTWGDETAGLRPWRAGDPLKWVAWKQVARQPLADRWISRTFENAQRTELWLDAAHCGLSDQEARLSRLCAWVLQAHEQGLDYGLRLTSVQIPPGSGPAHRQRCLEALALC